MQSVLIIPLILKKSLYHQEGVALYFMRTNMPETCKNKCILCSNKKLSLNLQAHRGLLLCENSFTVCGTIKKQNKKCWFNLKSNQCVIHVTCGTKYLN